ncbi:MAG: phosphatidylglycerol lysyltransferase domain-containing protein [Arcanobacterium sp.]|nr:phosphatidylglycerol lysyltransferase domain-containing protein [Arcanobacterium sp.]MDY5588994.1 phosphatidylglycerol lysyltransferase domain-containing protein [Arcanobacterium sp.]
MRAYCRRNPVSLGFIVLMWGLWIGGSVITHGKWPWRLMRELGYSVADPWPHVFTSGLTAANFAGLLLATAAVAIFGALSERRLGSVHYALAALVSQVLGIAGGTGFALLAEFLELSDGEFETARVLAPLWLVGVVAYASGTLPSLWRSRTRLAIGVYAVTRILYAGTLGDAIVLSGAVFGLAASAFLRRRSADRATVSMRILRSPRERRIALAVITVAVFLGPIFASVNPSSTGIFSPATLFAWHGGASQVQELCAINRASRACINAHYLSGHIGISGFLANQLPLGLMIVSAWGLTKGRRLAHWFTLAGSVLTLVAIALEIYSVAPSDALSLILVVLLFGLPWVVLIGLLMATRKDFVVHTGHKARKVFLLRVLGVAVASAAIWVIGAWLVRGQFDPVLSLGQIVSSTAMRFIPPALALSLHIPAFPHTAMARVVFLWPGILFWLVVMAALIVVLRSSPDSEEALNRQHARGLLMQGTGDHVSWMTLWPRNHYWFDPEGEGYVAFRLYSLVAVTLGGPVLVENMDQAQAVAQRFEDYATSMGWSVAWYSVSASFAQGRESNGWRSVQVAEESVLDASVEPAFTGKKFQDIRTARNHAAKQGIRIVEGTWAELSPSMQADIVALSEQWVSEKALPEMGFTLGGVDTLNDPEVHLVLAVDNNDHVQGATSWLPVYIEGTVQGWILDFMRRDANGFRPVVDFLIAEAWVSAHRRGAQWVSLSGAPLSHSKTEETSGPLLKMLDAVGSAMEPLYGFRSLASFKKKFQPEHHEWYLCYRDELGLPAIGLAVSHAYIPDLTFGQLVNAVRQLPAAKKQHSAGNGKRVKNAAGEKGEQPRLAKEGSHTNDGDGTGMPKSGGVTAQK